ncbi:MAG: hypothetical protein R3252_08475 [Robiginitalea sp.]|nr:hypothetical protein [Robiginitalea sp.]
MRRLSTLFFIVVMTALSSCSEVPENNDPVIGIWGQTQAPEDTSAKHMERVEWIFNDAFLGRYHVYQGDELVVQTDFQWNQRGGVYTIQYPGLKKVEDVVKIKENQEGVMLVDLGGNVLAFRE